MTTTETLKSRLLDTYLYATEFIPSDYEYLYCTCGHVLGDHYYYGLGYNPRFTFCRKKLCNCRRFEKNYREVNDMDKTGYKKVESKVWKPTQENEELAGTYKGQTQSVEYSNVVYHIENKEGEFAVFGSTILNDKMRNIVAGTEIIIIYLGLQENKKQGQNDIKLFEVWKK